METAALDFPSTAGYTSSMITLCRSLKRRQALLLYVEKWAAASDERKQLCRVLHDLSQELAAGEEELDAMIEARR
jgi:hypothetical protein